MINGDYLYDKSFFEKELNVEHFSDKKLSYCVYDDAYIMPYAARDGWGIGGIYTKDKEWISNTIYDAREMKREEIQAEKYCDETVIYIGWQNSVWGHTISNNLMHLWFLYTKEFKEKYANCKIVYIKNSKAPLGFTKSMTRLFEILEIDRSNFIPIEEKTQFAHIILPEQSFYKEDNVLRYTEEYKFFIDKVRKFQQENFTEAKEYEKMYYTYSKAGKGKVVGEDKLERFFARMGYKIIAPEEYSLDEQLNMLANCKHFASTIGSGSHNSVFLPNGAESVLIPRAFYVTKYQPLFDSMININAYYVDASLSVLVKRNVPMHGPFYYYESEQLRQFFGINEPCDSRFWRTQLKDLKKYLQKGSTYRNYSERYMPEYYSKQLSYCIEKYRETHKMRMFFRKCLKITPKTILKKIKNKIKK